MGPPYRTATRHAIAPTQMRRSRAAIDIDPAGGSRAIATREAPASASESERVDERLKRRRLMTSAWIVQEVAVERRAPVLEDPHEPAARYVFGQSLLGWVAVRSAGEPITLASAGSVRPRRWGSSRLD